MSTIHQWLADTNMERGVRLSVLSGVLPAALAGIVASYVGHVIPAKVVEKWFYETRCVGHCLPARMHANFIERHVGPHDYIVNVGMLRLEEPILLRTTDRTVGCRLIVLHTSMGGTLLFASAGRKMRPVNNKDIEDCVPKRKAEWVLKPVGRRFCRATSDTGAQPGSAVPQKSLPPRGLCRRGRTHRAAPRRGPQLAR
jgi:hypothetical protein